MEHKSGRHLFDYQSLFDKKTSEWTIGFDLPLIGQEILIIRYASKPQLKPIDGTFARRLNIEIKNRQQRESLSKFYSKLRKILVYISSDQELYRDIVMIEKSAGGITLKLDGLTLEAFSHSEGYFKRSRLTYEETPSRRDASLITLELFSNSCS